jgi:hypothetical protein
MSVEHWWNVRGNPSKQRKACFVTTLSSKTLELNPGLNNLKQVGILLRHDRATVRVIIIFLGNKLKLIEYLC